MVKVLSRVESHILQHTKGVYKDCGTKALCSSSSSRRYMKLMKLDFGGVLGK